MDNDPLNSLEKMLKFFERLYAHALTLQDMFENYDEITDETYPQVHPKYEKFAAEQFDMFYRALDDPAGFARSVQAFLDANSNTCRIQ